MEQTRYFIFNHARAFWQCRLFGFTHRGDHVVLEDETEGVLITPVMDCLEHGNTWRRVLAHMRLPEGTQATWRFYATDLEREQQELQTLLRGETADAGVLFKHLGRFEVCQQDNAADFLLHGVCGRYVVASVEASRPKHAPSVVLHTLQIYASWESFLPYLPECFRDENSFFDRLLRLFSAPYLELEQRIDTFSGTLDPRVAAPDTLRWLAEVMDIPHIDLWDTDNLRKLLVSGTYRKKGRLSALPELVMHYTGYRPFVVENFRALTGEWENDRLYEDVDINMYLPPEASGADLYLDALYLILDSFLPCGVTYRLLILDMYPMIPDRAYLGVNTRLGRYPDAELGVNSRLNYVILGDTSYGE